MPAPDPTPIPKTDRPSPTDLTDPAALVTSEPGIEEVQIIFGFAHIEDRERKERGESFLVHQTSANIPILFSNLTGARRYADFNRPMQGGPLLSETHDIVCLKRPEVEAVLRLSDNPFYILDGQIHPANPEAFDNIGVPVTPEGGTPDAN